MCWFAGIPLPVVMFLFVVCATGTCLTVGCLIARKTDILKVPPGCSVLPLRAIRSTLACDVHTTGVARALRASTEYDDGARWHTVLGGNEVV